ncbi:hypothetical protein ARMGADRAFT_1089770 [Armillaria gallica]|uniref:Uncharacterized protein n=1 Tax=Armillaria gallica TaxID=47427 RepID=A0A2H3CIW8_ARMGA|nr:hypothetical protein ARMGADRAFT_1089770 [Armillaria gallica]
MQAILDGSDVKDLHPSNQNALLEAFSHRPWMPAIGTTNQLNTRRIIVVILAAFFTAAGILFPFVLCLIAYDTAGIEEDEEEARAALPFHYIPQHELIPEPSLTLLPEARIRA